MGPMSLAYLLAPALLGGLAGLTLRVLVDRWAEIYGGGGDT